MSQESLPEQVKAVTNGDLSVVEQNKVIAELTGLARDFIVCLRAFSGIL